MPSTITGPQLIQLLRAPGPFGLPSWFTAAVLACAIHLAVYALIIRKIRGFGTEKGIVLYHGLSGSLFLAAMIALLDPRSPGAISLITGSGSVISIYSLTFLGLWASSDGGFSLRLLDHLEHAAGETNPDLSGLRRLGDEKKKDRIKSLERFGLVFEKNGRFSLSRKGTLTASALRALGWLCGQRAQETVR